MGASASPRPRFRLLLEAMPSDVPAFRRLALALKILKRTCEFRCLHVIEVDPDEVTDGQDRDGAGPDR